MILFTGLSRFSGHFGGDGPSPLNRDTTVFIKFLTILQYISRFLTKIALFLVPTYVCYPTLSKVLWPLISYANIYTVPLTFRSSLSISTRVTLWTAGLRWSLDSFGQSFYIFKWVFFATWQNHIKMFLETPEGKISAQTSLTHTHRWCVVSCDV